MKDRSLTHIVAVVIVASALFLAWCLTGCGGTPTPQLPTLWDLSLSLSDHTTGERVVADVGIDGLLVSTNEHGWVAAQVAPGEHHVEIAAPDYQPVTLTVVVTRHTRRAVVLDRLIPPLARLVLDGRHFIPRLRLASALTLLHQPPPSRRATLTQLHTLGFNGVRVFGGALQWAPQTAAEAEIALEPTLEDALRAGLYVYLVALTDSKDGGYDLPGHLHTMATRCAVHPNCFLEIANEPYHPTQADALHFPGRLLDLAKGSVGALVPYALGAASVDELDATGHYPYAGGAFDTAHLDRGRDKWNQVRRLRELAGISEATKRPMISGEPIGAAEVDQPGKRMADPTFFLAMGALCRGFELGCVFHSDLGLSAAVLTGNQLECAKQFLRGWDTLATDARLTYKNTGWADSPLHAADFTKVVRAYSFVSGVDGYVVLVGLTGAPALQWQGNWHPSATLLDAGPLQVLAIHRS